MTECYIVLAAVSLAGILVRRKFLNDRANGKIKRK
jgi:hypothetical protein